MDRLPAHRTLKLDVEDNLQYANTPSSVPLPSPSLVVLFPGLSPTQSPQTNTWREAPMSSVQERRRGPLLLLKPTPLFRPRRETFAASRSASYGTKQERRWACPLTVGTGFRRRSRSTRAGTKSRQGCSVCRARCSCKLLTSSRTRGVSRTLTLSCRQTRSSAR